MNLHENNKKHLSLKSPFVRSLNCGTECMEDVLSCPDLELDTFNLFGYPSVSPYDLVRCLCRVQSKEINLCGQADINLQNIHNAV